MTAKEGALLYSSGRLEKPVVLRLMRRRLERGHPTLPLDTVDIRIERARGFTARVLELDKVTVTYHPRPLLLRYFSDPLEESCVIKHAPPYRLFVWPLTFGPPVKW